MAAKAAFVIHCHIAEGLQGHIAQNRTRPEFVIKSTKQATRLERNLAVHGKQRKKQVGDQV